MRERFGSVGFVIRRELGDSLHPGWEVQVGQVKRMVPGSGLMIRQLITTGPARLSLRIRLDSLDDYLAMQAMLGRTSTLVLLNQFTNARGRTLFEDGCTWEYLDDTTLDELGPPKYELSGRIEAIATFERAFEPATGRAS